MAKQPCPEMALPAQATAVDKTEAPLLRTTRHGSQPPAQGTEEGKPPLLHSRRSSILSTHPGPLASRRSSLGASGLPLFQPIIKTRLENTYRMGPDEGRKFNAGRVQRVLEGTLASTLGAAVYSPQGSTLLAQSLAELLRSHAKEVVPPRYKLVCQVVLGQQNQQSLLVASRALWDPESDSFASATFSNSSLFAVATVHGVYFE
ncbi:PREDICTED: tctex1 domain-containing protein 4-like [Pterocles gutturalis]|nr:PREDICTED: tctex1 domain-containing protein 4-like [Pterocles gutturalis]